VPDTPGEPGATPATDPRAERGTRLLAATIDELILLAIAVPMIIRVIYALVPVATSLLAGDSTVELPTYSDLLGSLLVGPGFAITLCALLAWSVITAWLVATNGQSIGKRMVGIKVVRTNGLPASFARICLLRNVVNGLPTLFFPYLGLLYQLIDPLFIYQESRQCLHDKLADTIVIQCPRSSRRGLMQP